MLDKNRAFLAAVATKKPLVFVASSVEEENHQAESVTLTMLSGRRQVFSSKKCQEKNPQIMHNKRLWLYFQS